MGEGEQSDTGGNDTSNGTGWDDEDSDSLWDKLSGIGGSIADTVSGIADLPGKIANAIGGFFTALGERLESALTALGDAIIDGLKAIFVPDTNYINDAFGGFIDDLKSKFNVDTTAFESLFSEEKVLDDVEGEYEISGVGKFNFKFLDTSFLKNGIEFFRPFVRGFLVLLMLLYHIRQLIGFFGYDAGVVAGRTDAKSSAISIQRGE